MASQIPQKKKLKQAIRDEWAKIKSFGWKKGIEYIWDYYKVWILLIVLVPICVVVINNGDDIRELVFHCSVSAEAFYDYPEYFKEYDKFAGLDEEAQYGYIEPITKYGVLAGERHYNWINTEQLDMIVADSVVNENSMKMACFFELTTFLPEDLLEEFEDKLYYYENVEYGVKGYYAVDVSEYFGYGEGSAFEDGLFVSIPYNTHYPDSCIMFLRYLVECPPKDYVYVLE